MKKVVLIAVTGLIATAFIACKNEVPQNTSNEDTLTDVSLETTNEDLALADLSVDNPEETFMYVTAPSGLTLRAYANLQSDKLARMPYGTKVRVIAPESNKTMNVGGIKGGMDEVAFNHKKGYAFNGYLSKYFPPELNITVKGYASELQTLYPEVEYKEEAAGSASNPETIESLILPGAEWHEAYIIAQRLFDFPKEFELPSPKGKKSQIIFDGKPKKGIWTSQLEINRNDVGFEKIEYVYGSKKFDAVVSIEKHENGMKISKRETIK